LHIPLKTTPLKDKEELTNILNNSYRIAVSNIKNIDKQALSATLYYASETLQTINDKEIVKDHFKNKIKEHFPNASIEIAKLHQTNYIINRCTSNEIFFNSNYLYEETQANVLMTIIDDVYDFQIVSKDSFDNTGKSKIFSMRPRAILNLSILAYKFAMGQLKDENELLFYSSKDEIYAYLCYFLGYFNFIYNKFNEDFESETGFITKLKSQLNSNLFKGFVFVNKQKGTQTPIVQPHQMRDLIDKIRNNIAHANFNIKFSKSGLPQDNLLIFSYPNKDYLYYMVSCKDFLNFVTNPLFADHVETPNEITKINNYQEIIDIMKDKIKK
jgi:hypothetical protein